MTFDARGEDRVKNSDILFAGGVVVLIGLVFLAVLKGPDLFSSGSGAKGMVAAETKTDARGPLFDAYPDRPSRAFLVQLEKADPRLYADLERTVERRKGASRKDLNQLLMDQSQAMLERNARVLAKADASHFDALLDWGRDGLAKASRSGTKFCDGGFYAGLSDMRPHEAERLFKQIVDLEGPAYAFSMKGNTLLAKAIVDAKRNPVTHGALTPKDNAEIQRTMMSLMNDPTVMKLMMSANSNADPEKVLRGVDVCKLSDTVLAKLDRLPMDTKGRLFATAMKDAGSNPFSSFRF